jgi:cytochrome P450
MIARMSELLRVRRHAEVCAALADPRLVVPPAGAGGAAGTLRWLRATVSRFCSGTDRARRRAAVERELDRTEPDALRAAARERALALLSGDGPLDVMAELARPVPLAVLGVALGVPEDELPALADDVSVVAAAYFPGITAEQEALADAAVRRLAGLLGPEPDEAAASRIGLLVQACEATAGLIGGTLRLALQLPHSCLARPVDELVEETLRFEPPTRNTRREAVAGAVLGGRDLEAGTVVLLDLDAANRDSEVFDDPHRFDPDRPAGAHLTFGHGLRPCPGAEHALALASGVIEAVLSRAVLAQAETHYRPYPNLRVPESLVVALR